jgi:hypothetical protein
MDYWMALGTVNMFKPSDGDIMRYFSKKSCGFYMILLGLLDWPYFREYLNIPTILVWPRIWY